MNKLTQFQKWWDAGLQLGTMRDRESAWAAWSTAWDDMERENARLCAELAEAKAAIERLNDMLHAKDEGADSNDVTK